MRPKRRISGKIPVCWMISIFSSRFGNACPPTDTSPFMPGLAAVQEIILDGAVENKWTLRDQTQIVSNVFFRQIGNFPVADPDMTGSVFVELSDALGQGTFAAARKSDQRQLFTALDGKINVIEQLNVTVGFK